MADQIAGTWTNREAHPLEMRDRIIAAKERRIAELEAALRDAGGVIIATADLIGGFPQQLAQARREALEAAIREFSTDHDEDPFDRIWAIDKLRGIMAREVKP